ncbi:unnamed protein product [Aspergillus oryzae]|nr:unnamed protein product [Aspergillus oryzae]GMG06107.1 unnamed protein product [Aspergillus oryzae]
MWEFITYRFANGPDGTGVDAVDTLDMVSWIADSLRFVEFLREAVVEKQHARFQRPNQGHIAGPAGEKTFGTPDKDLGLLGGQRGPLSIIETDVGAILACGELLVIF